MKWNSLVYTGLSMLLCSAMPATAIIVEIPVNLGALQTTTLPDGMIEWSLPDIPITPVTISGGATETHEIRVSFADPSLVKLGQDELLLTDDAGFPSTQTIIFTALLRTENDVPVTLASSGVIRGIKLPEYNGLLDSAGSGNQSGGHPYLQHGSQLSNFDDDQDVQVSLVTMTVQATLAANQTFDRVSLQGRATTVQVIPRLCVGSSAVLHICDVPPACRNSKLCYSRRNRAGSLRVTTTTTTTTTTPPNFRSVMIPTPLSGNPAQFEVAFGGFTAPLVSGEEYLFESLVPGGVSEFEILGIDTQEVHDPADPQGFVSGVSFIPGSGSPDPFSVVSIAPASLPALGTMAIAVLTGALSLLGFAYFYANGRARLAASSNAAVKRTPHR